MQLERGRAAARRPHQRMRFERFIGTHPQRPHHRDAVDRHRAIAESVARSRQRDLDDGRRREQRLRADTVIGEDGAILGVAVSSISTLEAAKMTGGSVPQNVNFASSVGTLQSFLNAHHVNYVQTDGKEAHHNPADLADTATRYTVMIECWANE